MNDTPLVFSPDEAVPDRQAVLALQGIPADHPVSPAVASLCDDALRILAEVACPTGLVLEIETAAFDGIYPGEGDNAPDTPLQHIYPAADRLALFTVTIGHAVSDRIDACFRKDDPALAAMLDAAASAAADRLVQCLGQRYRQGLIAADHLPSDTAVLAYSPGYCGWHVTGQKRLFAALRPERIGIELTDASLMLPIKSCSGVLVAGSPEVHAFENNYPFCDACRDRTCRARIANLLNS